MVSLIIGILILGVIIMYLQKAFEFFLILFFPKAPSKAIDDLSTGLALFSLFGLIFSLAFREKVIETYFISLASFTLILNIIRKIYK